MSRSRSLGDRQQDIDILLSILSSPSDIGAAAQPIILMLPVSCARTTQDIDSRSTIHTSAHYRQRGYANDFALPTAG